MDMSFNICARPASTQTVPRDSQANCRRPFSHQLQLFIGRIRQSVTSLMPVRSLKVFFTIRPSMLYSVQPLHSIQGVTMRVAIYLILVDSNVWIRVDFHLGAISESTKSQGKSGLCENRQIVDPHLGQGSSRRQLIFTSITGRRVLPAGRSLDAHKYSTATSSMRIYPSSDPSNP